jgi:hypothetical protein
MTLSVCAVISPCGGSSAEKPPWVCVASALRNGKNSRVSHMPHNTLFAPLITLVLWTFVMWACLYAPRIPAIRKNRIPLDPTQSKEAFNAQIQPQARWKADKYNHLLEQPTLFYAVMLSLAVLGAAARSTRRLLGAMWRCASPTVCSRRR